MGQPDSHLKVPRGVVVPSSVVVITSALNAEGPGFHSQWNHKTAYISVQTVTLGVIFFYQTEHSYTFYWMKINIFSTRW